MLSRVRRALLLLLCLLAGLAGAREDPVAMDPAYDAAFDRGDIPEAERLALKFFQALPTTHDYSQETHIGGVRMLAEVRSWQARFTEAEMLLLPATNWLNANRPGKSELRASMNLQVGALYYDQGRYAKADEYLALALEALPQGKPLPREERILDTLRDSYLAQGRLWEALTATERLLPLREQLHGANDPLVGVTLVMLGELYGEPYRWQEQKRAFERAYAILEPAYRGKKPDPVAATERMIHFLDKGYAHYRDLGWKGDLCSLRRDLVSELEKKHGKVHADLVTPISDWASYCEEELRHGQKEDLHKRALDIAIRVHGMNHPVTSRSRRSLATFYASRERGDTERHAKLAGMLRRQAAEGTRITFGANSATYAREQLYDFLDEDVYECGFSRPDCGQRLLGWLAAVRADAGASHPSLALLIHAVAQKLGGYTSGSETDSKARHDFVDRLYREALQKLQGFYGSGHPTHALKAHQYAVWVQNHNRDLGEAATLLRGALAAYRTHYGDLDNATLQVWNEVLVLELRRKRYAEANAEAAALLRQLEGDSKAYRLVSMLLGVQAGALHLMGREEDALRAMERQVRVARDNADAPLWRQNQEQLVNAYRARGMKAEAEAAGRVLACLQRTRNDDKPNCS
jgi:tetratricopeptide (TPR) repeat protein